MKYIVANTNPDIDRLACAIAYAELLNKTGEKVECVYTGNLDEETSYIKSLTKFFPIIEKNNFKPDDEFVMVDMSFAPNPKSGVDPTRVVEVIDHRSFNNIEIYSNAKIDIQKVGSCATLIYERFKEKNITPNQETATWLLAAIISNTVNYKNAVTTDRDIESGKQLQELTGLGDNFASDIFKSKSNVNSKNLEDRYAQDFCIVNVVDKKCHIFQLEIIDVEKFLVENLNVISKLLLDSKQNKSIDYVMFSGIDLLQGVNVIFTPDPASAIFFASVFNGADISKPYKTDKIIMRKEIWAILHDSQKAFIVT